MWRIERARMKFKHVDGRHEPSGSTKGPRVPRHPEVAPPEL